MTEIEQKVKERIQVWKRFYADQTTDVDENSPWSDILLKLNLSYEQSVALGKDAIRKCSPFSFEESLYLRQLPLYYEVKQLAASLPNSNYGDCFYAVLPDASNIYFVRYPKLADQCEKNNPDAVPIVVATIVYHKEIPFNSDVYVWCGQGLSLQPTCKHLVIRYSNQAPDDFAYPEANSK